MVLSPLDRGFVSNLLVPGKIVNIQWDTDDKSRFCLLATPKWISGAAMAKAVGATEDGADLNGAKRKTALKELHAYLFKTGRKQWKLGFVADPRKAGYTLLHEKWSAPIPIEIDAPGRQGKCVLRVMVFNNGERLAVSETYDIGNLGCPKSLAKEIYEKLGSPTEHSIFYSEMCYLFRTDREDKDIIRLAQRDLTAQAKWIIDAAALCMKISPYEMFYLHHHYPDSVMHCYLAASEGAPDYTVKQKRLAKEAMEMCFEICDKLVSGLLKLANPKTTILLVSDHGDVPNQYSFDIEKRFVETKLLAPNARKKDAYLLGYHGKDALDVVWHYNSGFAWGGTQARKSVEKKTAGANHGPQMPVTFGKTSDNMAFFVLTGPGVKKNIRWSYETKGHVLLKDLVPTICHISGFPTPLHATGCVRREFLA